jgi:hypothetical protein
MIVREIISRLRNIHGLGLGFARFEAVLEDEKTISISVPKEYFWRYASVSTSGNPSLVWVKLSSVLLRMTGFTHIEIKLLREDGGFSPAWIRCSIRDLISLYSVDKEDAQEDAHCLDE